MVHIIFINVIFTLLIFGSSCVNVEQILVPTGEPFSFDCRQDESVYFGRQIDDWSEIQDNYDKYSYLTLNFNYIKQDNILRVKSNAAHSQNVGYYACSRSTTRTPQMTRIYQLILADIDLFYWSYACHAPVGSCVRFDDAADETQSTFEVADQTHVDLFCCASVSGYENVNINMNQIGENQNKIKVNRKQELDGSWVVCANQHTLMKKTYSRIPETFTCELIINDQVYSSYNSLVTVKGSMPTNPDIDSTDNFNPSPTDEEFFNRQRPSSAPGRRKLSIGKKLAIIFGSLIGCILLLTLLFIFVFFFLCKNKTLKNSTKKNKLNQHSLDRSINNSNDKKEQNPKEEEPLYVEPTPHYENAPVFLRL